MSEKVKIEFFDNIDQKPSETLKTDENLSLKCPEVNNNNKNTFKLIDSIIFTYLTEKFDFELCAWF